MYEIRNYLPSGDLSQGGRLERSQIRLGGATIMPILSHIFKKGSKIKSQSKVRPSVSALKIEKEQKVSVTEAPAKQSSSGRAAKKGGAAIKSHAAHIAYNVVVRPHISEKSVVGNNTGKYVFEVAYGASKQQIAQAIEKMYGVKIKKVNRVSVSDRPVRYKRTKGYKSRNDKAVITLEKGQEIEVLPQ
jgi:large subunit ribosomal protein L23